MRKKGEKVKNLPSDEEKELPFSTVLSAVTSQKMISELGLHVC